jgi:hypothetical protein
MTHRAPELTDRRAGTAYDDRVDRLPRSSDRAMVWKRGAEPTLWFF